VKTGSKLSDFNHYGGGMTQREVAAEMGCPYQSIQQTEGRAIAKYLKNWEIMFGRPDFCETTDEDLLKNALIHDNKGLLSLFDLDEGGF